MDKYRKKETAIIEAIQYIDKNKTLIMNFLLKSNTEKDEIIKNYSFNENGNLIIHTLEGDMKCNKGDYIIKGVDGEFYPCKQEIFEKTYELVYKIAIQPNKSPITFEILFYKSIICFIILIIILIYNFHTIRNF